MIYFVQGIDGGPVKIGYAVDPEKRLSDLQCGSPVKLRVVHVEHGSLADEAALHREFAGSRLHGEWFDADDPRLVSRLRSAQIAQNRIELVGARLPQSDLQPAFHGPLVEWYQRVLDALLFVGRGRWVRAGHVAHHAGVRPSSCGIALSTLRHRGWPIDRTVNSQDRTSLWAWAA